MKTYSEKAFFQYESIRDILPNNSPKKDARIISSLEEISQDYDNFLFDAFGVLNGAEGVIPSSLEAISRLQKMGKNCFVISNASGFEHQTYQLRYKKMGYSFDDENIIVSRDVVLDNLKTRINTEPDIKYGIISAARNQSDIENLIKPENRYYPDNEDFYYDSDVFLFLTTLEWNEDLQRRWEVELKLKPREIYVGNPDLIAPNAEKTSIEAGTYTLLLDKNLYTNLVKFGKPFLDIFQLAFKKIGNQFDLKRTIMIGDTLHTDILGANNASISSLLVLDHGFFRDFDYKQGMEISGIYPDFIINSLKF